MGDSYIEPCSPMQCFGPRAKKQGPERSRLIMWAKYFRCEELDVVTYPDYEDYAFYRLRHGHLRNKEEEKVLIKELTAEEQSVLEEHFRLELRAALALSIEHEFILKGIGWAPKIENNVAIVHEFTPRDTLHSKLQSDRFTWDDRIRASSELASVIMYLHGKEILHRNVTSRAVLLDVHSHVKLASFALAKFPGDGTERTSLIRIPEQINNNPEYIRSGVVTPAFDVYSFGMVLLEMATGMDASSILNTWYSPDWRSKMEAAVEKLGDRLNARLHSVPVDDQMERILKAGMCCALPRSSRPRPSLEQIDRYLRETWHTDHVAISSFIIDAPQRPADFIPAQIPEQFDIGIPEDYPSGGALKNYQRDMMLAFLSSLGDELSQNMRFTRIEELVRIYTGALMASSAPLEGWNSFAQSLLLRVKQFEVVAASYRDDYRRLLSDYTDGIYIRLSDLRLHV